MANTRQKFEEFSDMPEALSAFLMSDDLVKAMDPVKASYKLTDDQAREASGKLIDAAFNDFTLAEALNQIKTALVPAVVPEGNWPVLVAELVKIHAWPLRDLYDDEIKQVLNEYKINPSSWPSFRVILKPLTYSGAAAEVAAAAGFSLMGGQIKERLRDLIMSKIKGVRTDAQIRETLIRASNFGGLGLDAAMTDKAMEELNLLIKNAKILSEDEYSNWLAEEASKKTQAQAATLVAAPPKSEDELEIDKIKAGMPAPATPQSALDKAVEDIYGQLTFKPGDDYLAKRLRYIISSRLRDVRTEFELRQLLSRDIKVGGLSLPKDQADAIVNQIEQGYKNFRPDILNEEKQKLENQMAEQKVKIEERHKKEAEEHAAWYKEKVEARQKGEEKQKQVAEQMKQSFAAAHPIDAKEKRLETEKFGEMVNAVQAGATPIKAPAQAAPAKEEIVPASTPTSAARPEVKVSKATAALQMQAAAAKPRLSDVTFAPTRLSGPLQELKSMTLTEFRRLAKDPQAAALKIIEKIELMGQESFEARLEAIKAWQTCPLQSTYMSLVTESFKTGKQVVALAEEKRQAGADVPSEAELTAVISLNSKLHF